MKTFTVTETENGMRLLRLVSLLTQNMPKSLIYKSFRNGRVKIDGKKKPENYKVQTGEVVDMYINDEFFVKKETKKSPCDVLSLIYIDDNIAIAEKPQGLLCHSDETGDENLLDGFIEKYGGGTFRPCLVNRIDRGTHGLVMIARTHDAAQSLSTAIREKHIKKIYLAVTDKSVNGKKVSGYERKDRITTAVSGGADMVTIFKTIGEKKGYFLIEAELVTGKTHQIRAQLKQLGAHIVGDRKYFDIHSEKKHSEEKNQLLTAHKLIFDNLTPPLEYLNGKSFICEKSPVEVFFNNIK